MVGAIIFFGIAVYSYFYGGLDSRSFLALLITAYFLVGAFMGVKSPTANLIRIVIISGVLIYMISMYMS